MKRRMTLSLVLTLSVLLSLVSLASTAKAAPPQRFRFTTGVLTPGMGQTLRVTVVRGSDTTRLRFLWRQYMTPDCSGMPLVCRHTVESQGATPLVTLNDDDAVSFEVGGNGKGVNLGVESSSKDARVVVQIIDALTGDVTVSYIATDDLWQ